MRFGAGQDDLTDEIRHWEMIYVITYNGIL